jgi:glycosyltransferase involved in cell wall biosynthesis
MTDVDCSIPSSRRTGQQPGSVTVVIPYHNEESALLDRAIESVHAQSFSGAIDVIVVDDASEQGPEVSADSSIPIQVIRSGKNLGAAGARNLGLEAARGEFVAFLDADDVYLPDKLHGEVNWLLGSPEAVLVGAGGYIHRKGKIWAHVPHLVKSFCGDDPPSAPWLLPEYAAQRICYYYGYHTCGFTVRRQAICAVRGFDTSYCWGEDWELQIRLAQLGRIGFVPTLGYRYISRGNSITTTRNPRKAESAARLHRRSRHSVSKLTRSERRLLRQYEQTELLNASQIYTEARQPLSAWRCAGKAACLYPSLGGIRAIVETTVQLPTILFQNGRQRRAKLKGNE